MRSYVLRCEMRVPRSLEETFAIFENPHNLALITPPWLNFKVVPGRLEMRQGLLIDYTIRWLGVPLKWRTCIDHYEPPHMFVDRQARGPYQLWHHIHRFHEDRGGTLVSDQVTYVLPLGPLGRLAHAVLVKHQLLTIFRYRQRALAAMLGGADELREPWVEAASPITKQELAEYRA